MGLTNTSSAHGNQRPRRRRDQFERPRIRSPAPRTGVTVFRQTRRRPVSCVRAANWTPDALPRRRARSGVGVLLNQYPCVRVRVCMRARARVQACVCAPNACCLTFSLRMQLWPGPASAGVSKDTGLEKWLPCLLPGAARPTLPASMRSTAYLAYYLSRRDYLAGALAHGWISPDKWAHRQTD